MSLEKPPCSPQAQEEAIEGNSSKEDPLYRILSAEEDSDWEYAFMGAIRKPTTTMAPFQLRDEDNSNNLEQRNHAQRPTVISTTKLITLQPDQFSNPIELESAGKITEICEFHVPVTTVKPKGSLTLAEDRGADLQPISCPAPGLENLWSQEFISAPTLGIYQNSPNPYNSVPLHIVEGRDDPEDEGICMTSPPPITPVKTFHKLEVQPIQPPVEAAPQKPDEFFEKCDILQWAIDDQDIGEMPGISSSHTHSDIPATITSATANRQHFTKPLATTNFFIKEFKEEKDATENQPLPLWSPQISTPITRRLSEITDDDNPSPPKRKRGRPARDSPRDITPKLPRLPRGQTTSDSEYAYVSDSCGILTDDDVHALKYRRMRDLNNEASKRCRQTRKEKSFSQEIEVTQLMEKNQKLKEVIEKMETQVLEMKTKFLSEIRNPSIKIAMARRQMLGSRLGYERNIIGSLMDTQSEELPDVNTFWSV